MAGQRLASLKATATLDGQQYRTEAERIAAANAKMKSSQDGVKTSMQQTQVRASESARSLDKYRQSLDPVYRAQQQLAAGAARLNAGLERGSLTAAAHAHSMSLLQQRYAGAGTEASRLASSVGGLYGAFGNLRAVLAGVGALMAAREYFQFADTMTNISSKLRLVTSSSAELNTVQEKLLALSNATRSGFESTVQLYSRVARNADQLKLSQQGVLDLTETVQQAIRVSGTTASEASSGVIQFSQALASGRLSGDEFRSVMENMPRLARALSDGLGVTIGDLRELANDQKLTSDVVVAALQSQAAAIRAEFGQLPATVGESFTVLNNQMLAYVGKVDSAVGASKDFGASVTAFSEILNDPNTIAAGVTVVQFLANAFVGLGLAIAGAYKVMELAAAGLQQFPEVFTGEAGGGGVPSFRGLNSAAPKSKFFYNSGTPGAADSVAAPVFAPAANDNAARASVALPSARNREREAQAKSDANRAASLAKYIDGLEDEVRLTKLTALERAKEEAVLRAMEISGGKLSAIDAERVRNAVTLRDAAERQKEAIDEASRKAEEFASDVQGEVSGAFATLFNDGKEGFDSLIDYWKRRFFDFIADLAAKALINPIIMPVLQSAGLGLGALGSSAGGLGANFGTSGVGGVSSLGQSLGSLGKSIDQFGRDLGLQKGGATGPFAENTGLFGTNTALSDVAGGALGGLGIGSTVGALTGGNQVGSAVGGLIGGALGSFLGPIGTFVGGAIGGFLGGLFGPKPSNNAAFLKFDEFGTPSQIPYSKTTSETLSAVNNAASQIAGGIDVLERSGATLTDRLTQIVLGSRDPSHIEFASGLRLRSATGDPNALALAAVQGLAGSAQFDSASVAKVAGRSYGSLEEFAKALDFAKNVYDAIAEAKPGLTGTEQAMKDLTAGLKAARREAEKYGLSLDKLDLGARKLFDFDIGAQIRGIVDPVGAALDEFERGAKARVEVARQLGADLVQVERLNGLQRAQVLAQAASVSFDGLKSLIDDIAFGGLSSAAPDQQYFSVLSRFNTARRDALDNRTPEAIGEFESVSRALLPIARSFLGTSTSFANLQSTVVATARELGGSASDPAAIGQAIVAATANGSAQVVDAIQTMQRQIDDLIAENKRLNATLIATLNRAA